MGEEVFTLPVNVRYLEVDAQGVVLNAWYLAYFDDAMTAFLAHGGLPYQVMLDAGFGVWTRARPVPAGSLSSVLAAAGEPSPRNVLAEPAEQRVPFLAPPKSGSRPDVRHELPQL